MSTRLCARRPNVMSTDTASHAALLSGHEEGAALSIDEALSMAGAWSTYQKQLLMILGSATGCMAAHMLSPIFLIPRLAAEWDLSKSASSLQSSAFFVGYCIGVVIWASVSDSLGRRPATLAAFALGNLSGFLSFLSPTYSSFVFLRFICGIGVAGAKNGCFLLATEFAAPAQRARVGAYISYSWLSGLLYLVAAAWALQTWHWRWLFISYTPAILVQILLGRAIPESPRFLLVAGMPGRAQEVMLQVFLANGQPPPEPFTLQQPCDGSGATSSFDESRTGLGQKTVGGGLNATSGCRKAGTGGCALVPARAGSSSFGQLWRRGVRLQTSIIGFSQAVCTMVFYAITFDPKTNAAAGDLYLGALLGAIVELPAYLMLETAANGLGRVNSYTGFLVLSTLCLLSLDSASACATSCDAEDNLSRSAASNWNAMAWALGGRFASVAAVNVAYIVSAEVYPTSCRNTAVGWGTGCGRIGAIVAPMVMLSAPKPFVVFAVLSLMAATLVRLLPETVGMTLADVPAARPCERNAPHHSPKSRATDPSCDTGAVSCMHAGRPPKRLGRGCEADG